MEGRLTPTANEDKCFRLSYLHHYSSFVPVIPSFYSLFMCSIFSSHSKCQRHIGSPFPLSGFPTSTGPTLSFKKSAENRKLRKIQKKLKCSGMGSRGEFGVARRGKLALQIFDDVERQTADQCDGRHLPQERPGGNERQVWDK